MKYDKRYEYKIKRIYKNTIIGQYSDSHWGGNLIVMSNSEFRKLYDQMVQSGSEPTELMLYKFPKKNKFQACGELKREVKQRGVTGVNRWWS